jgi:mRNA interferase RelE/StbE
VLKELSDPQRYPAKIFRQLTLKIFALGQDPKPQDVQKIGADYRVDSGEYRIFYSINDDQHTVTILIVGKRDDDEIYRRIKRWLG